MDTIRILDESISNIIAAGEVVENPASMIKEFLENSLDAGSTSIKIEVGNSGRNVKVTDDGKGMSQEDIFLCIERHATSKIFTKEDIFNLSTYGFRGEALASIASVSRMSIASKREVDDLGGEIKVLAGKVTKSDKVPMNRGTDIEIKDLFYNTPARLKFLRKKSTEYAKIKEIVLKEALANPETSFILVMEGKEILKTNGRGMQNTILELFGRSVLKNIQEFPLGFLGNLEISKASKDHIYTYVNGRYVKSQIIEKAVMDGYYTKLTKGRYPFAVIFLQIDPKEVDVNVHPSKKIVKFSDNSFVYSQVFSEIEKAIGEDEELVSPVLSFDKIKKQGDNLINLNEFEEVIASEGEDPEETPEKKKDKKNNPENSFKGEVLKTKGIRLERTKESPKEDSGGATGENKEFLFGVEEKTSEYVKSQAAESIPEPEENTGTFRVIGQLSNSYILVERNNILEIYDQHIVQERVLYEILRKQHYSKGITVQNLLVPLKLTLDYDEKRIVFENLETFREFGFEIEEFGDDEILIRGVPVFDFRTSIENTFRFMLHELQMETGIKDFREKIIISMSCRNSIKAGEKLSLDEMKILIERLHETGKYTCPHGRPIIVKIPLDELEKKFKRK